MGERALRVAVPSLVKQVQGPPLGLRPPRLSKQSVANPGSQVPIEHFAGLESPFKTGGPLEAQVNSMDAQCPLCTMHMTSSVGGTRGPTTVAQLEGKALSWQTQELSPPWCGCAAVDPIVYVGSHSAPRAELKRILGMGPQLNGP